MRAQAPKTETDALLLDSVVSFWLGTEREHKSIFSYADGVTTETRYDWNNGRWNERDRTTTAEDEQGRRTHYETYLWQSTNGYWQGTNYELWEYDNQGRIIVHTQHAWDDAARAWASKQITRTAYNDQGNTIETERYQTDDTGTWQGVSKSTMAYDTPNNARTKIEYIWDDTRQAWNNSYRTEYKKDGQGRDTLQIGAYWDVAASIWQNETKIIVGYNDRGEANRQEYYDWDHSCACWCGFAKMLADIQPTEDPDIVRAYMVELVGQDCSTGHWEYGTKLVTDIWNGEWNVWGEEHTLDPETQEWKLTETISCEWDEQEHLTLQVYTSIDPTTGATTPDTTYQAIYEDGRLLEEHFYSNGEPLETILYYYGHGVDINATPIHPEQRNVSLFPNPAGDSFTVATDTPAWLEITDLNGRTLLRQPVNDGERVDISPFPAGTYAVTIHQPGRKVPMKVVKR